MGKFSLRRRKMTGKAFAISIISFAFLFHSCLSKPNIFTFDYGHNARTPRDYGGNLVEESFPGHSCSYECNDWPYKLCWMKDARGFGSSCIAPYHPTRLDYSGQPMKYSNWPYCIWAPGMSENVCMRCDDVCARRAENVENGNTDNSSHTLSIL